MWPVELTSQTSKSCSTLHPTHVPPVIQRCVTYEYYDAPALRTPSQVTTFALTVSSIACLLFLFFFAVSPPLLLLLLPPPPLFLLFHPRYHLPYSSPLTHPLLFPASFSSSSSTLYRSSSLLLHLIPPPFHFSFCLHLLLMDFGPQIKFLRRRLFFQRIHEATAVFMVPVAQVKP